MNAFIGALKKLRHLSFKLEHLAIMLIACGMALLAVIVVVDGIGAKRNAAEAKQLFADKNYLALVRVVLTRELVYHGILPPELCLECGDPAEYHLHRHWERLDPDCVLAPATHWPQ